MASASHQRLKLLSSVNTVACTVRAVPGRRCTRSTKTPRAAGASLNSMMPSSLRKTAHCLLQQNVGAVGCRFIFCKALTTNAALQTGPRLAGRAAGPAEEGLSRADLALHDGEMKDRATAGAMLLTRPAIFDQLKGVVFSLPTNRALQLQNRRHDGTTTVHDVSDTPQPTCGLGPAFAAVRASRSLLRSSAGWSIRQKYSKAFRAIASKSLPGLKRDPWICKRLKQGGGASLATMPVNAVRWFAAPHSSAPSQYGASPPRGRRA